MLKLGNSSSGSDGSFLPEDYLAKKAQRRTNAIAITLFAIVTAGVVGAFFVTHRQWNDVRNYQEAINVRYSQAAKDIEQLKQLETQKSELLAKAELTTSLIERVPRSILLAEVVNRMPEEMTLLELDLEAKRDRVVPVARAPKKTGSTNLAKRTAGAVKEAEPQPEAPRYTTTVMLIGVAPTHSLVAEYAKALQECTLLKEVELRFSDKTSIKDQEMFKFRVDCILDPDADARELDPMNNPRLEVNTTTDPLDGMITGVTINKQEGE